MIPNIRRIALILLAGAMLSACAQSSLRISPDFGNAVKQDVAAQIADPDAHYQGTPAPGSSGARVELAQKRYQTNTVIPPLSASASGKATGSSGGGGAGASS